MASRRAGPTTAAQAPEPPVYRLKVTLKGVRPPVWRRLQLSGGLTLAQLHLAIQLAMGWDNDHLYMFKIHGQAYGPPDEELPFADARRATLAAVLPEKGAAFLYEYDYGDSWEHAVTVEEISTDAPDAGPLCLGGARACPPEDCGGVEGYRRLLAILADPDNPEYEDMVRWTGGGLNPEAFDVAAANQRLQKEPGLRRRRPRGGRSVQRTDAPPEAAPSGPSVPPPAAGISREAQDLLNALVEKEMKRQGLPPEASNPGVIRLAVTWSVYQRALSRGLREEAMEQGLLAPPSTDPRA